jgi:hypothetical protein
MNQSKEVKTYLIISPEPWGASLLSKHHYAIELARRGNYVYFLNPPGIKPSINNKFSFDNLRQITYKDLRGTRLLPLQLRRLVQRIEIWMILRKMGRRPNIVWSFDPFRLQWLKEFRADVSIYHAVDNHFTKYESIAVEQADIFLANTPSIFKKFNIQTKYLIGHGLAEHFLETNLPKPNLPGKNLIKVGYVGNLLNQYIDYEAIENIIVEFPNVDFYFIGPKSKSNLNFGEMSIQADQILGKYQNVFYLGQKISSELPSYLQGFDILLIIYKRDKSGHLVNPHKLLEYLSSGAIVVATLNKDVMPEANGLVERIDYSHELAKTFKFVVSHQSQLMTKPKVEARKKIAASHTYEKKVDCIMKIIKENEER